MSRAGSLNYTYFSTLPIILGVLMLLYFDLGSSLLPYTKCPPAAEAHLLLQLHVKMIQPMG